MSPSNLSQKIWGFSFAFSILNLALVEGNGQLNIHVGQNYQDSGLPDLPEAHEIVHLIE